MRRVDSKKIDQTVAISKDLAVNITGGIFFSASARGVFMAAMVIRSDPLI